MMSLAAQMRDTPPHIVQYPFEMASQRGVAHAFCLAFVGYRANIAEIPPLLLGGGGIAPPLRMFSQGGNAQKRGRGYRTQLAMLRHQLGGHFGPEKKNLAPPPQKIPKFAAGTLPAPRPSRPSPPPPPGIFNQKPIPHPPGASDSPFPLPEQKKIKNIRNVHQAKNPWRAMGGVSLR